MRRRSRIGEPIDPLESFTWGDRAEDFRDSLRGFINSGHLWPHKKPLPDEIVDSIIEDLINDVAPQMAGVREDLTTHGEMIVVLGEWAQSLKEDDPLLVQYVGYQSRF